MVVLLARLCVGNPFRAAVLARLADFEQPRTELNYEPPPQNKTRILKFYAVEI